MAARVEFTNNAGDVKNMDKPTAMRLEARGLGKITKILTVGNANSAKAIAEMEEALLDAEIKIEAKDAEIAKLKALKKPANKADKDVKNRETK